ncbi:PIN domain nuclease [Streptomyces radiopugnans]|uniref:PIN domain nuclease n=1 Tax=Streptomyces radiopugnans TaxID=403935 RepID=UPI003F1B5BE7
MTAAVYLIDTSALVRILRQPVRDTWEKPLTEGIIARCPVTEVEFLYSARNAEDRAELVADLDALFGWSPLDDRAVSRAWDVQRELTKVGRHRSAGAVDLLIAATAELQGLTLLHYDRDFETIAEVTGQPTQWLVPPGSL